MLCAPDWWLSAALSWRARKGLPNWLHGKQILLRQIFLRGRIACGCVRQLIELICHLKQTVFDHEPFQFLPDFLLALRDAGQLSLKPRLFDNQVWKC